ncbi:MAG: hypothetical protein HOV71_07175 [Hamadaea sp.]|uniref:hypothetical protein n=1 Tax=Hamadaea sp. NPDC050747 TaxID=3155789 RepID=UPI0017C9B309|nr:hypothetical protein [Hamadaea sp.]NUR47899.1 hypothetical protein [Hamadaea sp.]NUT06642.1 hypothetical protein [Hamadaea sp.]
MSVSTSEPVRPSKVAQVWKASGKALIAAATLVAALIVAPSPAHAGDWGATVTEKNSDGRAEKFWVGGDGAVWHAWATTPGGPIDSGNYSLGGIVSSGVGVTHNQDGRLEIFGRAAGGDLNHKWQLSGGGWSGWASLGGQLKAYTGVYADYFSTNGGTIRVKVTGIDNLLHYKWQAAPNCCWRSYWE